VVGIGDGLEVIGLFEGSLVGDGVGREVLGLRVGGNTQVWISLPHGLTPFQ